MSAIAAFVLFSILFYPMGVHFIFVWKQKADDVIMSMTPRSAQLYFSTIRKLDVSIDAAPSLFRSMYIAQYGRRFLVLPIIITSTVGALSVILLGEAGELALRKSIGCVPKDYFLAAPDIAVASIAGAFAFVCWDIVSRVARRNLAPADILGAAIRLALAIPIGYAFSAVAKDEVGAFIAFSSGAFPIETVKTLFQRLANKKLGLEMGPDSANDQLTKLSGVDQNIADRIAEADITTIAQMAYCDPVQVTMRSRYSFAFISDVTSQALAWIYFDSKLNDLRPAGLRGAAEFSNLRDALVSSDQKQSAEAIALAEKIAITANLTLEEFRNTVNEIAEDPFTEFIVETW